MKIDTITNAERIEFLEEELERATSLNRVRLQKIFEVNRIRITEKNIHQREVKGLQTEIDRQDKEIRDLREELDRRERALDELFNKLKPLTDTLTNIKGNLSQTVEPEPEPAPEQKFLTPGKTLLHFELDPNEASWRTRHYKIRGWENFYRAYCYGINGLAEGSRLPAEGIVNFKTFEDAIVACSKHFWANRPLEF